MFCNQGYCCEKLNIEKENINEEKKLLKNPLNYSKKNNNSDEKILIRFVVNRDIKKKKQSECPENALIILNNDNLPQKCDSEQQCIGVSFFEI